MIDTPQRLDRLLHAYEAAWSQVDGWSRRSGVSWDLGQDALQETAIDALCRWPDVTRGEALLLCARRALRKEHAWWNLHARWEDHEAEALRRPVADSAKSDASVELLGRLDDALAGLEDSDVLILTELARGRSLRALAQLMGLSLAGLQKRLEQARQHAIVALRSTNSGKFPGVHLD